MTSKYMGVQDLKISFCRLCCARVETGVVNRNCILRSVTSVSVTVSVTLTVGGGWGDYQS